MAVLALVAVGMSACAGDGDRSAERGHDRPAAARREDGAVRDLRPAAVRGPKSPNSAPIRCSTRTPTGRRQAAAAGRVRARRGRRRARARRRRHAGGGEHRAAANAQGRAGRSPTTASSPAATSRTTSRSTTSRSAICRRPRSWPRSRRAGAGAAGILMVNGSPTDSNATQFAEGRTAGDRRSDLRVLAEYDTPDWSPDKAQEWVAGQISQYGGRDRGRVRGQRRRRQRRDLGAQGGQRVAVADRHRTGCRALRDPADHHRRPVMTVYKAIKPPGRARRRGGRRAAQGRGGRRAAGDRGHARDAARTCCGDDRRTSSQTVVADGFWTVEDICTPSALRVAALRMTARHPVTRVGLETMPSMTSMSMTQPRHGTRARARADDARHRQALRRGQGAHRRRLLGERGRGRRAHRRQRRRQVDARQGAVRRAHARTPGRSSTTASIVEIASPADAQELGIATVFQDLALCDNLDVVANLWLGRELRSGRTLDEVDMEQQTWTLLRELSAKIPSVRDAGRLAVRRSAPDRRDRPLADRRPAHRHPRRAHRRARASRRPPRC